ncbi:FtsB family cell division protein [Bacteroides fluxus]|jgi:cell division protein DivIC|uniref:Septum formation initiator n=1 Tax=Bacteroides fluxus YIT 12057 TaxID=763034 RepID=F3PVX4_9BACE|nr:septum formation initiator family protein [Bacteroides fluxus]EGF52688.1 septum formation initiator [Bacteroides fluxus YIT 12057]MDY3788640.1 septum formation initiator family protein [Bacteroides fluxus]
MDKLAFLWSFFRKHKYLITLVLFAVIVGFLDENSMVRRLGYAREENRLRGEIERYRKEYEENTERLNELVADSGAIERIAREKYLMKKPNEDIYVFEGDIEE